MELVKDNWLENKTVFKLTGYISFLTVRLRNKGYDSITTLTEEGIMIESLKVTYYF
jgi:hypothetical protein